MRKISNPIATLIHALLLFVPARCFSQQDCNAILLQGAFSSNHLRSNAYARQILAARMSTLSRQESERLLGANADISFANFPIGVDFSDEQYQAWQREVRQSMDVDTTIDRQIEILSSVGDATIVQGWNECMRDSNRGLRVELTPLGDPNIELKVTWDPGPGAPETIAISSAVEIRGARIEEGAVLLREGAELRRGNSVVLLLTRQDNEPVAVGINTSVVGRSAYLPRLVPLPTVTRTPHLVRSLTNGQQCTILFPSRRGDDHLGTIARGVAYTIRYDRDTGRYTTTGHVALQRRTQTATYGGPSPSEHRLVIWGEQFSFRDDGTVTSYNRTTGRIKLEGTLLCP